MKGEMDRLIFSHDSLSLFLYLSILNLSEMIAIKLQLLNKRLDI